MNYGNLLDTLYFLVMEANESSLGGAGHFIYLIKYNWASYQIGIVSEYLLCVRLFSALYVYSLSVLLGALWDMYYIHFHFIDKKTDLQLSSLLKFR